MKKIIAILVFITLFAFVCRKKDAESTNNGFKKFEPDGVFSLNIKSQLDSIYFSLQSPCNFVVDLTDEDSIIVKLNSTSFIGKLNRSPYDEGYHDFYSNDSLIFMLGFSEEFFIPNQRYQFSCTGGSKIILLTRKGDPLNKKRFYEYLEYSPEVLVEPSGLNDKAYYLEQAGIYEEAAFILEKVIEKFPDRIVAYINLGDSYWGLEEKEKAKEAYQTYISLMKKSGKEARIPKRIYERVQ